MKIRNTFSRYGLQALSLLLILTLPMSGCKTSKRTAQGAVIGAAAGGAIGGVIGSKNDKTAKGIIIGAIIGGATGAVIGHYMDQQAKEMQKELENAQVERVGEGILVTFDSGIMFDVNSSALRPATRANLDDLAQIINKYQDTNLLVQGHTDNTGSDEYNQTLSEKRAKAVSDYLKGKAVQGGRLTTVGYGEAQPIADNNTTAGRQQNRRVEIAIYANDELVKAAERGEIKVKN